MFSTDREEHVSVVPSLHPRSNLFTCDIILGDNAPFRELVYAVKSLLFARDTGKIDMDGDAPCRVRPPFVGAAPSPPGQMRH